jgi:hypothetical protein
MLLKDVEFNWLAAVFPYIAGMVLFYIIVLVLAYFIIKKAVSAGTKEHRTLAATTNNLLIELLKAQGSDPDKLKTFTQQK